MKSNKRIFSRIFRVIALVLVLSFSASFASVEASAQKKSSIKTGTFKDWNGIDHINIRKIFDFDDYSKILIMPVDVSAVVLPDQSDNTYQPMVDVLNSLQEYAADYLRKPLKKTPVSISAAKTLLPEPKTLAFNMKIDEFDPGNRALRAWVGFGAGRAAVQISGDVVDAATGEVLLSFSQRRLSAMDLASHEKVLLELLKEIDSDLAKMLLKFR